LILGGDNIYDIFYFFMTDSLNSSIDKNELNKFNKNYHEWWDKDGEFKILHDITPLRLSYILTHIQRHNGNVKASEISVLDIGCGGGLLSFPLADLGFKVTGLDANINNYHACIEKLRTEGAQFSSTLNIEFVHSTIESYANENFAQQDAKKYDVITCLEVIEHVANPQLFLAKTISLLKKNGILILSTINRTIKSYLLAIVLAEKILKWMPKGTHDYSKCVKPSELLAMMKGLGVSFLDLQGMNFSLSAQNWALSNDIDVNYFMVMKNDSD